MHLLGDIYVHVKQSLLSDSWVQNLKKNKFEWEANQRHKDPYLLAPMKPYCCSARNFHSESANLAYNQKGFSYTFIFAEISIMGHLWGEKKCFWYLHLRCKKIFSIFFLMWTTFKVFIKFVIMLPLFYILVFLAGSMWDLSLPSRDQTHTSCIGGQSLNHWTTREVSWCILLSISVKDLP